MNIKLNRESSLVVLIAVMILVGNFSWEVVEKIGFKMEVKRKGESS